MKVNRFCVDKIKSILCVSLFLFFCLPEFLLAQRDNPVILHVGAAPAWKRGLGDLVRGKPFLQAESAVIACAGGSIKSYYMTGTALWDFDAKERVTPFIARSVEGASYLCDATGSLRALNRIGRELWRLNLGKPISHPPVVGWDGRVFLPLESQLRCCTASGYPLWIIDLGSPIATAPFLDHAGNLVTVLRNMDLVRINQFSTVERIKLDQMPLLIISHKFENQDDYVLFYPSGEAEKIKYSEEAGGEARLSRGSFPSLPASPAAVVSWEDKFAVTLKDGRVLLIDESGQVLWTGDSHETASEKGSANLDSAKAAMVFDERGIYSISTRGATGFTLDGRRRFIHKIAEASSVPSFSDEGLLYVCGTDGTLHTYKIDNKPRTVPRSRYYGPEPEGSYGLGHPPPSPWANEYDRFQDEKQDNMYAIIEKAVNSGQLGEDEPAYVAYLMEMIGFFLYDPHFSRVRPAVNPFRHVRFINLLGKIGSRETIPFLCNIFDRYQEPSVKSACAEAMGMIGVDPFGRAFESYSFLLAANNPNRDPQLLLSATSSIAALCRFSGPPLSADGIYVLRYFSNLTWAPNTVKSQIRQEIEALYREGLDKIID